MTLLWAACGRCFTDLPLSPRALQEKREAYEEQKMKQSTGYDFDGPPLKTGVLKVLRFTAIGSSTHPDSLALLSSLPPSLCRSAPRCTPGPSFTASCGTAYCSFTGKTSPRRGSAPSFWPAA